MAPVPFLTGDGFSPDLFRPLKPKPFEGGNMSELGNDLIEGSVHFYETEPSIFARQIPEGFLEL